MVVSQMFLYVQVSCDHVSKYRYHRGRFVSCLLHTELPLYESISHFQEHAQNVKVSCAINYRRSYEANA
jgi:hypothetical protein